MIRHPPRSPLFPSTPLSRSRHADGRKQLRQSLLEPLASHLRQQVGELRPGVREPARRPRAYHVAQAVARSEEHTSELQSLAYLVCRLLLEKKKKYTLKSPQT